MSPPPVVPQAPVAPMSMYERYLVSTRPYYQPPLNPLQYTAIPALPRLQDQDQYIQDADDSSSEEESEDESEVSSPQRIMTCKEIKAPVDIYYQRGDSKGERARKVGLGSAPKTPKEEISSSPPPQTPDQEEPITPFSLRSPPTPTCNYVRRNEFLEELEFGKTPCPGERKCGSGMRKRDLRRMIGDLGGRCGLEGRFVRRRLEWN